MHATHRFLFAAALVCVAVVPALAANERPIIDYSSIFHPVVARNGMVATQDARVSRIGVDILKAGGNAVDAAVAIGFALAVTLPRAGNLGGGGFMLVYLEKEGRTIAIDYREAAPANARRDMFLGPSGEVDPSLSRYGHMAAGIPGTVAGLIHALENYGTMDLKTVIAPAIRLAREGFAISFDLSGALKRRGKRLKVSKAAAAIFFKPGGGFYEGGERLVQKDLAWTLEQIARDGRAAFYEGEVAAKIVADMAAHGGLITARDLKNYKVIERAPVEGSYRGYTIRAMPPPSSGGVHLVQLLNILEGDDIAGLGHNSAATLHLMAEAMKLAYADRSEYLGDPDFHDVPVAGLTAKEYAAGQRKSISPDRARPSSEIKPGQPAPPESPDTTHYSVMDGHGNVVANTYTLNFSYGSGHVVAGAGFLLNNEMDDFAAKPGVPNAFGLMGGEANAVEAGKRPLSSMTPVILFRDGKPFLVTGARGGSTIITVVLQTILDVVDHGMNVAAAAAAPHIHHQWLPDKLFVEPGISPDTIRLLEAKGHNVQQRGAMGSTQTIMRRDGLFFGAADPRRQDAAAIGY